MKRQKLIELLINHGCLLLRHGKKHDIYHNPTTGASEPVPRHNDINEHLAKHILKSLAGNNNK
ncbi:type II toxin-antitoxin system HicA family toxin [Allochromatium warmingii]|uniref:type II toxin-antitoxin system HicA family toxin n=1 Tax=Allochromatium warmingii TaxID=61595 RepID=UPI000B841ADC